MFEERCNQVALEDEPRGPYRSAGGHYSLNINGMKRDFLRMLSLAGFSLENPFLFLILSNGSSV